MRAINKKEEETSQIQHRPKLSAHLHDKPPTYSKQKKTEADSLVKSKRRRAINNPNM